jgi:hypothetical protein
MIHPGACLQLELSVSPSSCTRQPSAILDAAPSGSAAVVAVAPAIAVTLWSYPCTLCWEGCTPTITTFAAAVTIGDAPPLELASSWCGFGDLTGPVLFAALACTDVCAALFLFHSGLLLV